MTTTVGLALLMVAFLILALLIFFLLDDWYKALAVLPLLVVFFMFPALASSVMQDSKDCQYLVNQSVQVGDTHYFDYEYSCQDVTQTSKTAYKVTLYMIVALGGLLFFFWIFQTINEKSGAV